MMEACWMTAPFVTWRRSFGTETRRLSVQGNVEFLFGYFPELHKRHCSCEAINQVGEHRVNSSRNNGAEFLEAVE